MRTQSRDLFRLIRTLARLPIMLPEDLNRHHYRHQAKRLSGRWIGRGSLCVFDCVKLKESGRVAQLVEQCPFKAWVAGSSPAALTKISRYLLDFGGVDFGYPR